MNKILFLLIIIPQIVFCQDNKLSFFEYFMQKTWHAQGTWGNGKPFKQELTFRYSLDNNIVITETKGFVDNDQKIFGLRNHGIRKYDTASNEIQFWEFDVFGGLTKGTVTSKGKDIIYKYLYAETNVTDYWEYVNDSTYNLKIGVFENDEWKQTFSSVVFKAINKPKAQQMYDILKAKLIGNWSSSAWAGTLYESWSIDENGHICQRAEYIENKEVLYESVNKIEIVNNEIILFTVIDDNNPKIFKATSYAEENIVFENNDYKNPNKVIYNFKNNEFERTISGVENGESTSYTFHFSQIK